MCICPCAYHAFKHLFVILGDRYIHMHTEGKRKRKVIVYQVQMRDISLKSIDKSPVNCYFEVDLARPFPYNELPEEDHKAFKINKCYFFIRKKTGIYNFFLYRGIF